VALLSAVSRSFSFSMVKYDVAILLLIRLLCQVFCQAGNNTRRGRDRGRG
jgi:hypothetical protein